MNTPSNNNTISEEDRKATVSIRNMSLPLWYKAGYRCKCNGVTLSEYVTALIEKDLEDTSNKQ
jgi:hypothetical protein